jgi:hypothetical protein
MLKSLLRLSLTSLVLMLSASAENWKLVPDKMLTPWAKEVSPENAWKEYPRPQLKRKQWTCLNGLWDYTVQPKEATAPGKGGKILVPFCPESALSGVGRLIEPSESLWYSRGLPAAIAGKRSILHFEAVDYRTEVFVNGKSVGTHVGGNLPFSFDITDSLKAEGNELQVRVIDETEGYQLHGKQKLKNEGIWYTRVTGIWQTVWLENVPPSYIEDLDFDSSIESGSVSIRAKVAGSAEPKFQAKISFGGKVIAESTGNANLTLTIPEAKLWTPDAPHLYDVSVSLLGDDGKPRDTVQSYTALRKFGKTKDAAGHWRYTLNDTIIFPWGPLDQGWWPDGLLTPPSEAAMVSDLEYLKAAGFNMLRKHIKVEPRRYYAACDRMGIMVWQDQVSSGYGSSRDGESSPRWTRMAPEPKDAEWPTEAKQQWIAEYKGMVEHLRDVPSISSWIPFNEAWGQHDTMEMGKLAVELDKSRIINIASGGNFWPVGDVADHHAYPNPDFPLGEARFDPFIKVVGEFGGHGWPVDGHLWKKDNANWGYGGLPKSLDEWKERYRRSMDILIDFKKHGIAAGIYTQTTDVEVEINGFLTYDRVKKIEPAWLKEQADRLYASAGLVKTQTLLETGQDRARPSMYTVEAPKADWEKLEFDAAANGWKKGPSGFGAEGTPGARIRTPWTSENIWFRREFVNAEPTAGEHFLRIYHDEDAQVFLDGQLIADLKGHNGQYADIRLEKTSSIPAGKHVVAVHCKQTTGGQFIDLGLFVETAVK